MTAEDKRHIFSSTALPDGEVARLAARAIAILLEANDGRSAAAEERLRLLCDAYLSDRPETRHAVLARLREDGIPTETIIDRVIPEIARHVGRRWADDDLSFADVTIVSARLQETVRALGRKARDRQERAEGRAPARRRILLVIPRPEHHTLGAFVAADQLRRLGFEVDVALDLHARQIGEMVRHTPFCMVGITAAGRRTLASAKELVDTIRASVTRVTPVVLGGSVVGGGRNLKSMTGVDHVVSDIASALRVCGLSTEREDAAHDAP